MQRILTCKSHPNILKIYHQTMKKPLYILFALFLLSCGRETDSQFNLDDLQVYAPELMVSIDTVDDTFFGHIGYSSIVLDNGNVLIPDRQHVKIFVVDSEGNTVGSVLSEGKGPREIGDVSFITKSEHHGALVYDQYNKKIVIIDSEGQYKDEFIAPNHNLGGNINLSWVYETAQDEFLFVYRSFQYFRERDAEQLSYLITYNRETGLFGEPVTIRSIPYGIHDNGAGGRITPFSSGDLFSFSEETSSLYLYWSGANTIAQLNAELDTTQVINFTIEPERITNQELDSLRSEFPEYWTSMRSFLTDYKAYADQMMVDHQDNIWLRLNHKHEQQQWLVVSGSEELLGIVLLPKEAMLTHISADHLGVRLDDGTFALFEPVF